jgi:hypothetical protein
MVVTTPNSQVSHDYPSIVAMPIIILRISAWEGKWTFWQVCTQPIYFTKCNKVKIPPLLPK